MINNTHYNLIDTFNFIMGRENFSLLYHDFIDDFYVPMKEKNANVYLPDVITAWTDARNNMPRPVAATLIDCFLWIHKGVDEGGGAGYGVK
jgi:hypothetical protein